ncbi:CAF17-like 4Fe-4S cluster assembly/insertion protein YgfZ [Burkholderia plantarii]|uniref:Glycine cleavage system protein GcvT n=1 Tax=Burkholderia plantarii TaxID=41899 RepID=A0A0B6RNC8_BURPL|nr:folate-binding protein YgfZ [Burkholderia plantarii]AJK46822.1 glycine cleavage system protein GcvT [Burkholderia plantarii]
MNSPIANGAPPAPPEFARPQDAEFEAVQTHGAYTPLPQLGLIDVAGDDAATFLHSQLTNDIEHLDAASVKLAGYCSPKGRLLASFLVWRTSGGVQLLLSKELQPAVQKRLSMFVLRAKAKLGDAGAESVALGFAGDVREALSGLFDALPDGVHTKLDGPAGTLIRLPDAAGQPRYLWIARRADAEARAAELDAKLARVSPAVWNWLEIRAAEPRITQPVVEQFVPQMVNYDVIGAVNFRKGCYPGQEIVARSQYRGTIKRRTALAHVDGDTAEVRAGVELFHSADPGQPCGLVVNAAAAPGGGVDLLAEVKLAAQEGGSVHLGGADGAPLAFLPLPYALPTEV